MNVVKDLVQRKLIRAGAYPTNLYQLLSNLPRDGVGARLAPESWQAYGAPQHFHFTIEHVRLSPVRCALTTC